MKSFKCSFVLMKQFYQIFIVVRIYISDDVSEMNDLWLKYTRYITWCIRNKGEVNGKICCT